MLRLIEMLRWATPPTAGLHQVLGGDETAFIIICRHMGSCNAFAHPVKKYQRDIPLLQFQQMTRVLCRSARDRITPSTPSTLQAGG